ncbi:MAG: zinc ribbon domain-containing protein [Trichodesmium sp. MO_231.B1]|nr:zinc ribbon domain-containing protein [Trichodesmium sp. MO_231.B1]
MCCELCKTRRTAITFICDAGWGKFLAILSAKAENAGQLTIAMNPNGTTTDCSHCGEKVPKKVVRQDSFLP